MTTNLIQALPDVEMHVMNVLKDILDTYGKLRDDLENIGVDGKTLLEWTGKSPGLVHALETALQDERRKGRSHD